MPKPLLFDGHLALSGSMFRIKVSRNGTIRLPAEWRRQAGNPAEVGLRVDADGNLIVFPVGGEIALGEYAHMAASSEDVRRLRDREMATGD
jgi:bifunctional DNA-binding transcriptional regulator/antitoxin component of YhaV-PrlF toxin-antitoxin module